MWLILSRIWTPFSRTCFSFNIHPGGFIPYPFFRWLIVLLYTGLHLHWIAPHKTCCFLLYVMVHLKHVRTLPGTSTKTPQRSLFLPSTICTQRIVPYLLLFVNLHASFVCFPIFLHWKVQKTSIYIQNWILDPSSTKIS